VVLKTICQFASMI